MTEDLIKQMELDKLPKHIAIIMDGNGRWARKRFLPRTAGHKAGVDKVKEIVQTVGDLGIKYLTLYAFSTENWNRPKEEIESLMKLLLYYIRSELKTLHKNEVRIQVIGDISQIQTLPRKEILRAVEMTKNNNKLILNIALNYGGRSELVRAAKLFAKDVKDGRLDINSIDEESFKQYLYTGSQPDPDLLIRPSGELRISNFLLYQIAYSEFWFSNIYWPDFSKKHLYQAIIDFQQRDRRYGGIKDDE